MGSKKHDDEGNNNTVAVVFIAVGLVALLAWKQFNGGSVKPAEEKRVLPSVERMWNPEPR